ncbi:MAG: hypothetical protein H6766_03960 [Candidatus Peribacteria bacterium]|nr:MAG: hypothetical protein H6766_03960 [Candidatus Peribacteria bacterium]
MLDIRCVYGNTIALHTCDHQLLVIGNEIGRAQQYADAMDLVVRYDPTIYQYGHINIRDHVDHLTCTHNNKVMIYDKGITTTSPLPDYITVILVDIHLGYAHLIPLLKHRKPETIIIMPTVDQETAIRCASDLMRE